MTHPAFITHLAAEADPTAGSTGDVKTFLWFGGVALGMVAVIQLVRVLKGGTFSANFTRMFGLVLIATLGAGLASTNLASDTKTGAFTLLGTIAGYLAGARATKKGLLQVWLTSHLWGCALRKDGCHAEEVPAGVQA